MIINPDLHCTRKDIRKRNIEMCYDGDAKAYYRDKAITIGIALITGILAFGMIYFTINNTGEPVPQDFTLRIHEYDTFKSIPSNYPTLWFQQMGRALSPYTSALVGFVAACLTAVMLDDTKYPQKQHTNKNKNLTRRFNYHLKK